MAMLMPSGYRSATQYHFDKEQTDTITFVSVIWYSAREHVAIIPSIATSFQRTPNVGLSDLDRLPLELLFDTLYTLDMQSLFKFRQVNLRSRQIVDSLKQYQRVVSHRLNLFCALLRTRLAIYISLLDFDNALCTKTCALCGEFGGFICLPTWKRCCFKCLQESPETQVQTLASVRKQLRMTKAESDQLRPFKCLPGIYSMNETVQKSRITIVSLHQATLACREQPIGHEPSKLDRILKYNFMGACALPYYDKESGELERGISCAGCQLAIEKDIIGTRDTAWGYQARDKVYARDDFLDHFRWCEQAQLLWRSSGEGKSRPPELPVSARTGGYFRRE
ncbi:hypothetical protein BO94DRAFT_564671 [Aspergillus sclerotioniger CBS 115572]|uniref:F-box domain-containing protein n=1 Tax=Aspergillus sclerotioniger CBS 115572 TaxID=1450535 RepID=A0A317X4V7_9EURO|nr:hypothetical protein BO94DRAFT_564671 [Aspergillus sclerotioniger CBS 115572]PWY91988.1 hypothetical protein BO94DRAFT_564671 [Aspergillus sclerotioniger CBS 115572]